MDLANLRQFFIAFFISMIALNLYFYFYMPMLLWNLVLTAPPLLVGLYDVTQTSHTILRNFPIIGHFRYVLEAIRPEINQYFIESNQDGKPFSRELRSLIYQRSKRVLDTIPFGTQDDVYATGYEWITHSFAPKHFSAQQLRIMVGGDECKHKYNASIMNISAMSYGALSTNAIRALNGGAKDGNFAHNTGEGGISPYHLENGGDLIWQIGTGYFGCRNRDGTFNGDLFKEGAQRPEVKMIELKLSQGAKPGHGGILPKEKVTREIADIRKIVMGEDVLSPPGHSAFSTPIELCLFIQKMRELSGGKPVGFKFCLGKRYEFISVCKAMIETGILPDYIAVDAGEGGTGAAPAEFSNSVGFPGIDGQLFVHNALIGFGLRRRIRLIASGRLVTGFHVIKRLALGADMVYSARAMMMAMGCIQALRCNNNTCPTGIATQDKRLVAGLVPSIKRDRVKNYHAETMKSTAELLGAIGLNELNQLRPFHIIRRASPQRHYTYDELFEFIPDGSLLGPNVPSSFKFYLEGTKASSFDRNA
ncbi:FMN-binding glutamate synthase family protein [bacterium]|nr:FMN-binding glutamate synthase family protein [bacterium]